MARGPSGRQGRLTGWAKGPTVTLTDAGGLTISSTVDVTVQQTPTSVAVSPATASVPLGGSLTFAATALDQFSGALSPQPSATWAVSGGGTIDAASGVFAAGTVAGGPYTVTATAGSVSGTAQVMVGREPPQDVAGNVGCACDGGGGGLAPWLLVGLFALRRPKRRRGSTLALRQARGERGR